MLKWARKLPYSHSFTDQLNYQSNFKSLVIPPESKWNWNFNYFNVLHAAQLKFYRWTYLLSIHLKGSQPTFTYGLEAQTRG